MQQLVEQHLLVRLPGGQGQHWVNKAADEGGGEARHLYGGTGREAVPLRRGGNLGGTRLPRRLAPAQRRPQADIGDEIASQQRQNPCEIEEVQPVCPGPGSCRGRQRNGGGYRRQGVRPGEQSFGRLHQPGPVDKDVPPAPARRYQQHQPQHAPGGGLPPGGELVPEHGLHRQQQRRRTGDCQSLQQKAPEIGHGLHLHLVQQPPQLFPFLGGDRLLLQKSGYQVPGGALVYPPEEALPLLPLAVLPV